MTEGILNVLKPPGMTSHDVVGFLRRVSGEKRIGHCGALDPQAAGVLPVCLGQATRCAEFLSGREKSYYCEMKTGYETDTQDIWGDTTFVYPDGASSFLCGASDFYRAAVPLTGRIEQEVPAYSSVKRDGISLHRLARQGKPVVGIYREIEIFSLKVTDFKKGKICFLVECASGTYVRMLCRDLGRTLGCGSVMAFLLRLSVGIFSLKDSVTLEEIAQSADISELLKPKEWALEGLPMVKADSLESEKLRQGQALWLSVQTQPKQQTQQVQQNQDEQQCWVEDPRGRLVAVGRMRAGTGEGGGQVLFQPEKTFV